MQDGGAPTQHVETTFGLLAFARLAGFSLLGIVPAAIAVSVVLTMRLLQVVDPIPETDYGHGYTFARGEPERVARERHDVIGFGVIALAVLAGLVVPARVLVRRQPPGTRLELDDWGITELEGDEVRTAIAWEGATVHARQTNLGARVVGRTLSVASPAGWSIFVGFGRHGVPWWAFRRRVTGVVDVTTPDALRTRLADGPVATDPRDARRGMFVASRVLDLVFVLALGLAALFVSAHGGAREPGGLLVLAGIVAAARAYRPWLELRALAVEAGQLFGARPFRLAGLVAPALASAEDESGALVKLDFGAVRHPDARLATRWTRVHAVTDAGASADAPLRVRAVETGQGWNERERLRTVNRIEIAFRLALALGLVVAGGLLAGGAHP